VAERANRLRWEVLALDEFSPLALYRLLQLRQDVFVLEQACLYRDLDDKDQLALHMLCWDGDALLAGQRCLPPGSVFAESSIGRIVVAGAGRGTGLGRELVRRGVEHNLGRWPGRGIRINAQAYLTAFYRELGFVPVGDEYDEDGIPHIEMLHPPGQAAARGSELQHESHGPVIDE
jgi:ElaA protein